jgi:tetratricopeptide (TPR) repeat protein
MALCMIASVGGAGSAGAQSLWDDPAFALYRQALEALDRKDYARAGLLAREAIAQYPGHVLAHYVEGQAALAQGKWDEAVTAFTKVGHLYPGSFAARRDLGVALEQLGRIEDAANAFDAALALRPDIEDVRVRLAFMLLQANQRDRAVPHLQALADRQTKLPEVWSALGRVYYERGDLAGSQKAFSRAVELREDGKSWFNLAVVRLRLGDQDGALKAFERAARDPDLRAQATREIGRLREQRKAPEPSRGGMEPSQRR